MVLIRGLYIAIIMVMYRMDYIAIYMDMTRGV
jgi:hypothetical protein